MDLEKKESSKSTYGSVDSGESKVLKDTGVNNPPSSRSKTWLWIIIILIIAVIVFFIVRSCVAPPTPVDVEEISTNEKQEEVVGETETDEITIMDENNNADAQMERIPTSETIVSTGTETVNAPHKQKNVNPVNDVEATAINVIRGDYGNGQERKDRLGTAYADVQSRVNEMYRQGLVE